MNKVILMGRLTRDPEISQTPSGVQLARFTIAVNRRFAKEGQQQADFLNCTAWRNTAEFICKYFKKGSMIAVVGSVQTRSWDAQDGTKRYSTDIVVDEAYFTGSRNGTSPSDVANEYASLTQSAPKPVGEDNGAEPNFDDFADMGFSAMDGADDDLPF